MKKRIALFLACLFTVVSLATAQVSQTTGKVVAADDGEPLVGATVKVQGTNIGTITDANGKFTIKGIPSGSKKLVVSCIGMNDQVVNIKSNLNIVMEADTKQLNDVMVVAYGTATKAAFTGSAAVVGADKIEQLTSTNALDALNGHVAGVEVYNLTGDPTSSNPTVRIRGISSISAGSSPLIIVDGTPYGGDMNTINTNDIETMTVLKDAAANSLYGSRAANGVIMITTKKGKSGNNAKVTLDANWGSNSRAQREYKTINNPAQYYEAYYQSLNNYATNVLGYDATKANAWSNNNLTANNGYGLVMNVYDVPQGQFMIGTNGKLNPYAVMGNVVNYKGQDYMLMADDWMKEVYHNSLRQEYNLTVSNGNDKGSFYASVGYLDNNGITNNSGYEAMSGRLKADLQAKPWLKVGANMSFNHYNGQRVGEDGASNSSGNPFAVATQVAPIYPMYIRDGEGRIMLDSNGFQMYDWADGNNAGIVRPYLPGSNAVQSTILDENQFEGNSFYVNGFAEIRFAKDFKFTSSNTVNLDETRYTNVINGYYGSYATSNGIVSKSHSRGLSYTYQQLLTWAHQFNQHDVDVLVGHEYYRNNSYSLGAGKSYQFDPNNDELDGAITDQSNASSSRGFYNVESYFARAQYNYAQKYFLSASVRRDASSRFSPKGSNWWGTFYSAGAAWVISQEKFMQNASWIDLLKFKASYGENGNDQIGSFRYTNTYSIVNSNGHAAAIPGTMGNKDIKWEKNANFNTGFEFELFKSRLSGGVEYFWRKTSDMLYWFSTPVSFGWTGYYTNIGDMTNNGVEVELSADLIRKKNVKWTFGMNMTNYRNEIKSMPKERKTKTVYDFDGKGYHGYGSGNFFLAEGLSWHQWYGQKYAGVYTEDTYQMTGDETYDPSKAGSSMWYKQIWEDKKDADGNVVLDEKGEVVQEFKGNKATTSYSDASQYVMDKTTPKLYGGFNTHLELYGFDLGLDFAYQIGGKVYDGDYASFMGSPTASSKGKNMHADILNSWSAQNTGSDIPRLQFADQYNGSWSSRFFTKASYLSLQNITFGYTLPADLTRKAKIEKVRLYANASNVWLWSCRQGLDPRVAMVGGGGNASYYSPIRTISAGINVTF